MSDFASQAEQAAKDKLQCQCGNADWRQFLFVGTDSSIQSAGCKHCGSVYLYQNGQWRKL